MFERVALPLVEDLIFGRNGEQVLTRLDLKIPTSGVGRAQLVGGQTRYQKVASFIPSRRGRRILFSRVNFLC